MNRNKKLGKLRSLIHKYDCHVCYHAKPDFDLVSHLDQNSYKEIKKLVLDLNIKKDEYLKISSEESQKINLYRESLKNNDPKESRDNKGVYVGSGNSNTHKIRYPKKSRSKKVWTIFYKMFPDCAKADGWDGETSKRMK